jgi:hypothetical protein
MTDYYVRKNGIYIYSDNDWIEICKLWADNHEQKLPKYNDFIMYYDRKIDLGAFIKRIRRGFRKDLKPEIEKIFGCKLEKTKICRKCDWIDICKRWIEIYGNTLPKEKDKLFYNDEIINIGHFINSLKHGYNKRLKNEIELLFNQSIKPKSKK